MSKNTIIAILGTIVGLFVIMMIAGAILTAREENATPTYTNTTTSSAPLDYSKPQMRQVFMNACNDGTLYAYCSCVYDELLSTYTDSQLEKVIADMEYGVIAPEIYDIIGTCSSEVV